MKSILEYTNEYFFNKSMINESFKASILQEISKQCNDTIKRNKEINDERGWNWKQTSNTFKRLLGNESIAWDELTDDMFTEYEKNEKTIDMVSKMMSSLKKSEPIIVFLINDNEEAKEKYVGALIHLYSSNESTFISFLTEYGWNKIIKRRDIDDLLTKKFVIVNVGKYITVDTKRERNQATWGAINIFNDAEVREEYYKKVANENRERYRKYLAKVKAERDSKDDIPEKVKEYSNKIFDVAEKLSSNPVKYSKFEWEIGYLLDLLNDKRTYVRQTINKGYYSGKDGLLTLFKRYLSLKLSLAKGTSYSYEEQSYSSVKKDIENIFKDIDKEINKFDEVE